MRVVEFLGVPGSGKSTLAGLLADALAGGVTLERAVQRALATDAGDPVTRVVARLARSSEGKLWNSTYARSTDRFAALSRFLSDNPALIAAVARIQQDRADRDVRPDLVLDWVLNLMARYQLATRHGDGGWLVVDEGFAQRGVALLAGGFIEEDLGLLDPYLAAIPASEVVVAVETPLDVCENRLDSGGWSQRLTGLEAQHRRAFLEATSTLSAKIASDLEVAGRRVIWVSGTTSPPDSIARVAATLTS